MCPSPAPLRRVSPRFRLLVALGALLAMAACGDDGDEGPAPASLVGAWQATKCEYREAPAPNRVVDLVADGWTISLTMTADGRYVYATQPPGGDLHEQGGGWHLDGATVVLWHDGYMFSWQFDVHLGEGTLALSGADAEYDFDGNSTPEAATWNLAFHD